MDSYEFFFCFFLSAHQSGKSHKGHRQNAGCNQCDGDTPQCFWNILQFQPFPQAGKEDQRQRESDRYGYGIYHRFAQVVLFLHQRMATPDGGSS